MHMLQVHVFVTECVQVHGAISVCVCVCGEHPWVLFIGTIHLPFGTGSLTGLELTKKARLGMPRIHLSNSHPSDTRITAMLLLWW